MKDIIMGIKQAQAGIRLAECMLRLINLDIEGDLQFWQDSLDFWGNSLEFWQREQELEVQRCPE